MTNYQLTLDGQSHVVETSTRYAAAIIERFPHVANDPGHFNFLCLKHSCPWISQLPEARQSELRHYCDSLESLRRRRQEWRAKNQ